MVGRKEVSSNVHKMSGNVEEGTVLRWAGRNCLARGERNCILKGEQKCLVMWRKELSGNGVECTEV
jgi:hypothetical protein